MRFSLDDARRARARAPGADHRRALRLPDGHRVGQGRRDGKIYILQARPETVQSRAGRIDAALHAQERSTVLAERPQHRPAHRRGPGARHPRRRARWRASQSGDVLVADMTDPDWEPVMKRAAAIVTNRGGRTCHAAIIARELGIPAVVGCGDATDDDPRRPGRHRVLRRGRHRLRLRGRCSTSSSTQIELDALPQIPVKIMMNVGNPDRAFDFAGMPNHGVGLARLEFIINRMIGVHPRALLEFDTLDAGPAGHDPRARWPATPTRSRSTSTSSARASRTIAAAFAPQAGDRAPVGLQVERVREPDRRRALRAARGEPDARLPRRLALRRRERSGRASSSSAGRCKRVRDEMGLTNVQIMVPFVRTLDEARAGDRAARRERPEARRERPQDHHDVRAADQCAARRAVPRALRRHVDRLERHDAADAGPRPRFRDRRARCSTSATTR